MFLLRFSHHCFGNGYCTSRCFLADSTNGRVTDSRILCPFVSVGVRFLSVPHAVNAFRVR